jgi:hypothetical protein
MADGIKTHTLLPLRGNFEPGNADPVISIKLAQNIKLTARVIKRVFTYTQIPATKPPIQKFGSNGDSVA